MVQIPLKTTAVLPAASPPALLALFPCNFSEGKVIEGPSGLADLSVSVMSVDTPRRPVGWPTSLRPVPSILCHTKRASSLDLGVCPSRKEQNVVSQEGGKAGFSVFSHCQEPFWKSHPDPLHGMLFFFFFPNTQHPFFWDICVSLGVCFVHQQKLPMQEEPC